MKFVLSPHLTVSSALSLPILDKIYTNMNIKQLALTQNVRSLGKKQTDKNKNMVCAWKRERKERERERERERGKKKEKKQKEKFKRDIHPPKEQKKEQKKKREHIDLFVMQMASASPVLCIYHIKAFPFLGNK